MSSRGRAAGGTIVGASLGRRKIVTSSLGAAVRGATGGLSLPGWPPRPPLLTAGASLGFSTGVGGWRAAGAPACAGLPASCFAGAAGCWNGMVHS